MAALAANTCLESLTLLASYELGRKFVKAASVFWPCVKAVLTEIHTEHVHTIRFECHPEDLEDTVALDVDQLLSRPAFTSLSAVVFSFPRVEGYSYGELVEMSKNAFAKTSALGCLMVLTF